MGADGPEQQKPVVILLCPCYNYPQHSLSPCKTF